ncbi:unnamed protein product [Brachionus calyciflorus]|uniref:Uncharacterized protein n=1 Tax=Brachionus calyciflorus TaxID=104777 RepID=A0A813P3U2_9BILA|nr:unnamed protein product [Brachionus calyciflorus]
MNIENQEIKKTKKRKAILEIITQWALSTTAHGFGNIARAESIILKIIWSVFLITSIAYCTYQIVLFIIQFAQFNVITSSKIVYEEPTNFPSVVICNLNAYDGNVARGHMDEILSEKNISQQNYEPVDFVDSAADYFKSTFEARALKNDFDLYYNGFYLSQMLFSCRFQGVKCNVDDFERYHDFNYGNCYRFNGNKSSIRKAKQAGWRNGLRLELYIGDLEAQQQYTYKAGMRVIIHNQSLIPFSDEQGIDVSVGQQTNIGISRTFIDRLPYPYSYCIDNFTSEENLKRNKFFLVILDRYPEMTDYSRLYCFKACFQEFIMKNCKCFDLKLPRPSNSSTNSTGCEKVNEVLCVQQSETEFYNGSEIENCYINCPNECSQVLYDTKISTAKYPSKWYTSILNNSTISLDYFFEFLNSSDYLVLQQTILMVNIYYDNMYYTVVTDFPEITIDLLIAYIGGNFGLFVGISLLSLVEFIEIIFYTVYVFIKRRNCMRFRRIKTKDVPKEIQIAPTI